MSKIIRTCEICSKKFEAFPSEIKYRGARFCGRSCASKWKASQRDITGINNPSYGVRRCGKSNPMYGKLGDKNANWKGGRYQRGDGYIRLTIDGVEILEHRYVMESKLNRKLSTEDIVHHIDGNPANNSVDNLIIVSREEHGRIHHGSYSFA